MNLHGITFATECVDYSVYLTCVENNDCSGKIYKNYEFYAVYLNYVMECLILLTR